MYLYKESGKFGIIDLLLVFVIGIFASVVISAGFYYLIELIHLNLLIIFPVIQVFLLFAVIYLIFFKRKIRNAKMMLFFAVVFGLVLYITPHLLAYNNIKSAFADYYEESGQNNLEIGIVDYIKIRADLGVTVKRALSKSQDWGSIGFYFIELINLFLLVGG